MLHRERQIVQHRGTDKQKSALSFICYFVCIWNTKYVIINRWVESEWWGVQFTGQKGKEEQCKWSRCIRLYQSCILFSICWQPVQIHKTGVNMFVLGSLAGKTSSIVSSSHAHAKLCLQVFDGFLKISVSQKWKWKSYHSFVSLSIVLIMNDLHFTGTFPRLITYKPDKVNNRNLSSLSVWAFFLQVEAHAAFVNWYYFLADKHFEFRVVLYYYSTSTSKPKKSKYMLSWPKPARNRLDYWIVTVAVWWHLFLLATNPHPFNCFILAIHIQT